MINVKTNKTKKYCICYFGFIWFNNNNIILYCFHVHNNTAGKRYSLQYISTEQVKNKVLHRVSWVYSRKLANLLHVRKSSRDDTRSSNTNLILKLTSNTGIEFQRKEEHDCNECRSYTKHHRFIYINGVVEQSVTWYKGNWGRAKNDQPATAVSTRWIIIIIIIKIIPHAQMGVKKCL